MKRFYFACSLCFAVNSLLDAQEKKGVWGLTASLNDPNVQLAYYGQGGLSLDAGGNMTNPGSKINRSISLSIIPKYYINNQLLFRFEYGFANIDLKNTNKTYSEPTSGNVTKSSDFIRQHLNRYVGALQFIFFGNKKIESFGGASLQYIQYSQITRDLTTEQRDAVNDTLISSSESNVTIPGGYAAGLGVFAGFNFFPLKRVSIGCEFSTALLKYKVGGIYAENYSYFYKSGPQGSIANYMNDSYSGIRFARILSSFNISLWFN